jgi:hypothetical protein
MSDALIDRCSKLLARAERAGEPESWPIPISEADLRGLIQRAYPATYPPTTVASLPWPGAVNIPGFISPQ